MLVTRFAALTVAALVLWGAAASAGGALRPFRYGFWSGGAYTDERTGAFTHCSAGVAYDSGVNLFVLVTGEYRWWLGIINPKWSFAPNAKTPIRLRLDSAPPFDRFATVPNGQLLLIPLPDNSQLIDAFRHAAELALDAEGQALFFKLNQTPGMMDRLTSCVRTSLALADAAAVRGSRSPVTFRAAGSGEAAAPVTPAEAATAPRTAPPQSANAPAASDETAVPSTAAPKPSDVVTNAQSLSPSSFSADTGSSPEKGASEHAATAASDQPPAAGMAKSPVIETPPAVSAKPAALPTDGASEIAGSPANRSIAALAPAPATASNPSATPQTPPPPAGRPPLAFTAVNPMISAPPPLPTLGEEPAAVAALEEVRLATEFLSNARLPDAHLIVADKPPALADFAAVWRSEDAAGAVKIIPPGPDVSAMAIASNLIAVDPQVCKGDFTSARLRTDVANRAVFSAVLTCNEASEERVTQYLIVPRQQGGFVVFAVIRSKNAGQAQDLDRQNLEGLSRAAIQAVGGSG